MAMTFLQNKVTVPGTWTNYTSVSCSLWFKINTSKNPNRLTGTDDVWEVRVSSDWTGDYRFANEFFMSTNTSPPTVSTTVIASGVWYHAVATCIKGGVSNVYINGVFEATKATNADSPTLTTMTLGNRDNQPAGDALDGVIDDLRYYNRILSANEVSTIYACRGSDNILYGLQARWLLDEGAEGVAATGTGTIKDATGVWHGDPVSSPVYAGSFLKTRNING
jgi:hypothetical protein